jgi:protein involved in polysaccharide export with SLBB domain
MTSFAFGYSQSELAQMASENPALLDTPQAQEYMRTHNVNVGGGVVTQGTKYNLPVVENDIEQKKPVSTKPTTQVAAKEKQQVWEAVKSGEAETLDTTAEVMTDDEVLTQDVKGDATQTDGSRRLTPLKYESDDAQIERIKSIQVHRGKIAGTLERFSDEFFRNKNKIDQSNIPVPADYTLNRGDVIKFWIYGKKEKNFTLKVNNEGNIDIPEVGPVRVAGESFLEVKTLLTNYLSSSYKNSRVIVSLDAFSNAQVTVTGFVNAPGIYNTTSVSSVKNILISAHGVSEVGSVRKIQIKRGGSIIKSIDFYDLISQGLDGGDFVLKPNDVVHIPRADGLVTITGKVYKEAIYEIRNGETLWSILSFAGGLKPDADGLTISVKRYARNSQIQNLTLSASQAKTFIVNDGDEIYVYGLNTTQDRYVMITGNVIREGKRAISGTRMSLRRLLRNEMRGGRLDSLFLENTRFDYAMIKRIGSDTKPKVFSINLKAILDGRSDFTLHNRDELYIFNELDTGSAPYVMIEGSPLIKPGKYIYHKGMSLLDLINQAGVKRPYDTAKVKIVSGQDKYGKKTVTMINMDSNSNYMLHDKDVVTLFDLSQTHPVETATISGEVVKPGTYAITDGMSLADFIKSAGGLNQKAYSGDCEVVRYIMENGERTKRIFNVHLNEANSFLVQQYDEINIKRAPNWNERRTVTLLGEVRFPGTYVIHSGEKLSSVIQRAGGFTERAFLYGAIFTRKSVREIQREALQRELSKLKEQVILVNVRNSSVPNKAVADISGIVKAVDSLIAESKKFQPKGRITVALEEDLNNFEYSSSNLTLEDGDVLKIPSYNDTVVVNGEVMLPTAIAYQDSDIKSYIDRSGGLTHLADNEHIYVIHANGEAEKANLGSWLFSSNNVCIRKGDVITVPKKFYYDTRNIELSKDIADIFYKISLTVAAAHTVGAI